MAYVDGVVVPVANDKREDYITKAKLIGEVFREYGATRVVDCWGSDVPDGKVTSFPMAVKRAANEAVVFAWVEWPSKAVRDEAWQTVMTDERIKQTDLPVDGQRMIFGGFEIVAES